MVNNILYFRYSSFMLMKTNPLLTGNIKITIDTNENMWLNTMNANTELSNNKYKKYKISPLSSYPIDIYNFFDKGTVPTDIIFDIYEYNNNYNVIRTLPYEQYDNFYSAGATMLNETYYDEEFSFFAPLYINDILPDYFVIFSVDHPISVNSYNNYNDKEIIKETLSNAKIIKTYSLKEDSNIGKYIRSIQSMYLYTNEPLFVSFDKDINSSYTGISIANGTITTKYENLYDILTNDMPIKQLEKYITEGFKRNGLIFPNILNLEFLFNDNLSDDYSINRYFGLFVSSVELDNFQVNGSILSSYNEQLPIPRKNIDILPYSNNELIQSNDNGIKIPIQNANLITYGNDFTIDNNSHFYVINDKKGSLHRIKDIYNKQKHIGNDYYEYKEIQLYDKKFNINSLCGTTNILFQQKAILSDASPSQMVIYLYMHNNVVIDDNEKISIIYNDSINYTEWEMTANSNGLQSGDAWDYPVYDINEHKYKNTFSNEGTTNDVANALANCINNFRSPFFKALAIDNKIYIITTITSNSTNKFKIKRTLSQHSILNNVRLYDIAPDSNIIQNNKYSYNFIGGNKRKRNRAIIPKKSPNITDNTYFQTQKNTYSKIKSFNVGITSINKLPYLDNPIYKDNKLIGFQNIDKYDVIELDDDNKEFLISSDNIITGYDVFIPSISLLSIFPVKTFDTDFYQSDYANFPIGELYKYFEKYEILINDAVIELPNNEFFRIIKGYGVLEGYYNNNWEFICNINENQNIDTCYFNTITDIYKYSDDNRIYEFIKKYDKFRVVKNINCDVLTIVKHLYSKLNNQLLSNTDEDIINFTGFAALTDTYIINDDIIINTLKNNEDFDRFTHLMLNTEYDRLAENIIDEYKDISKVVPYINKWVQFGTDVRNNQYRLNNSMSFGKTGMSPSFIEANNPNSFTHEWYFIDNIPNHIDKIYLNNTNYICAPLDDTPIDNRTWKELLYDTTTDYFIKYFVSGYPYDTIDNEYMHYNKKENWSYITYNKYTNEAYTIFKGAKINVNSNNNAKYDNYKFSAILTRKKKLSNEHIDPISIEIIDNEKFKFIVFIITVYIQDYKDLEYTTLYTLNNNYFNGFIYNNVPNNFYDNNKIYDFNKFITILDYADTETDIKIINFNQNNVYTIYNTNDFLATTYKKNNMGDLSIFNANITSFNSNELDALPEIISTYKNTLFYDFNDNTSYVTTLTKKLRVNHQLPNRFTLSNNNITIILYPTQQDNYNYSYIKYFANNISLLKYYLIDYPPHINTNYNTPETFLLNYGHEYNKQLNDFLSFKNIYNIVNNNSNIIKYITVNDIVTYDNFKLSFIPPTTITKENILKYDINNDKYEIIKTTGTETMYRYSGYYKPKFKDIIKFAVNENKSIINFFNKDFMLLNTNIDIDNNKNFIIPNLCVCKLADNQLTMQSYIESKNHNILLSNFDNNFYKKYLADNSSQEISGLIYPMHFKNYFGSTLIKLKNNYILDNFIDNEYEIQYDDDLITITIDINNKFIKKLLDDNISKEFEYIKSTISSPLSLMQPNEFDDYILKYINNNILNLFYIKEVNVLYQLSYTNNNVILDKNIDYIINNKLIKEKYYKIDINDNILKVIINMDKNLPKNYFLYIKMGKI